MTHVLDISQYSFKEVLNLFELDYNISEDDLKRAKKKVLMTHPDKSRLPPEYFLFYKKAFDIVIDYYKNLNKQNQKIPEKTVYQTNHGLDEHISIQLKNAIQKMDQDEFHTKFNAAFEKSLDRRIDPTRNEWFSKDDPVYSVNETVTKSNMNAAIERVKETQQNNAMIRYNGVTHLYSNQGTVSNFYEEIDNDTSNEYLTSDIFSKLKFDDIRKVHKDQTVFSVSERDYANVPQYGSVEQFSQSRNKMDLTPLERSRAEQILMDQKRIENEKMQEKMHKMNTISNEYKKKTNDALSSFLLLK
jgi:cation transport regulator ChaB